MIADDISAVTFDLDNTLLEYERSPGEVLQRAYENLGVDPLFPVSEYYDRYDEFAAKYDSMTTLREECFATLASERGHEPERGRAVAREFEAERDQSRVAFVAGAERVLSVASDRYRTAIITNGAADAQRKKLAALGLGERVDAVVVAGAECPPKPSPKPFERALATLGVEPSTAVHVGDSLETDVAGANAVGAASVWIGEGDPDRFDPIATVGSTQELLDLPWLS
ncbi:HAD-IA family hydrolase [Halovenus sp. WSH3]|uniref:HAD-IA family hydrolase n=1 Tax=Halovenus carboxidivorans TaxID=2692199 RepID=A0A6B0TCJ2_9EURY|nr:HAD family hydrolase [Halovenus carboxidivorans]MXR50919.1 HAD-IA family hydrolase [Halovenus carboxidivorans]